MSQQQRFTALLKVCDMACAQAAATQADQRAEFWETLAIALDDDCPEQAETARRLANTLRIAEGQRESFLALIHTA